MCCQCRCSTTAGALAVGCCAATWLCSKHQSIFGCKPVGPVQNLNPEMSKEQKRSLVSVVALRSARRDCASLGDEYSVTISERFLLLYCSSTHRARSLLGSSGALLDSVQSPRRTYVTRILVGLIGLHLALSARQCTVCFHFVLAVCIA